MVDNVAIVFEDREQILYGVQANSNVVLYYNQSLCDHNLVPHCLRGNLENLKLRLEQVYPNLRGSLHKFHNAISGDSVHNSNDFSYMEFLNVLDVLRGQLGYDLGESYLTNLELGFNLEIDENPSQLISKKVLMHDFKDHNRDERFRSKGTFKEFIYSDWSLKIYDKGKQNGITDRHLLRVELKVTKRRFLRKFGIGDPYISENSIRQLFAFLLKEFDKLIMVDSLNPLGNLNMDEMRLFHDGINPNHWKGLKDEVSDYKIRTKKKRFQNLLLGKNLIHSKNKIRKQLILKFDNGMNNCQSPKMNFVG